MNQEKFSDFTSKHLDFTHANVDFMYFINKKCDSTNNTGNFIGENCDCNYCSKHAVDFPMRET
jgi:hypothetical protein